MDQGDHISHLNYNMLTRKQMSSQYGSGYPGGYSGRGVQGKPFPFIFWPIVWLGIVSSIVYLDVTEVRTRLIFVIDCL